MQSPGASRQPVAGINHTISMTNPRNHLVHCYVLAVLLTNDARTRDSRLMTKRCRMVQILRMRPIAVFRVFDRNGRAIGEVVQPRSAPVVGRGAGTVLLVRGKQGEDQSAPRSKALLSA